ncbi:hypothetical protein PAPHI01_2577 [Pancytospora philotis]|nr:hypothetical protein PAPHI01_2577 [Pancytospora philotis]
MPAGYTYGSEVERSAYELTQKTGDSAAQAMLYDPKAAKYMFEYYTVLKTLFIRTGGVKSLYDVSQSPFYEFIVGLCCDKDVRVMLVLLMLASGEDIWCDCENIRSASVDEKLLYALSLVCYGHGRQPDLESFDASTMRVLRFFIVHGGEKVGEIDAYGLGYTYSLNFLARSFILGFFSSELRLKSFLYHVEYVIYVLNMGPRPYRHWSNYFTADKDRASKYYLDRCKELGII